MQRNFKELLEQAKKELTEDIKSGKIKLNEAADLDELKEVQKLVKIANILIEKGVDKDGDKLEVVDPESTYEEPYTYDLIKIEGEKVTVTSYATMKGNKKEVDVMKVGNISDSVVEYLKSIIKGFKRAYKEAGIPLPTSKSELQEGEVVIAKDESDPQAKQAANDAIKRGDTVRYVKPGTTLQEKKDKEEEEPIEDTEESKPEDVEKPSTSTPDAISSELEEHIKQAIDSAAEFIKSIDDKKYETALGKVIKNLTMAQGALEAVKVRENKLAEEAGILREKSIKKYSDTFIKGLKKYIKDETLMNKILSLYKKAIEAYHDKKVPAEKMTEQVWKHFTLNEGMQKKVGYILTEAAGDQDLDNLTQFVKGPIANSKFKSIESDVDVVKDGKDLVVKYTVNGQPKDLPTDALKELENKYKVDKTPKGYILTPGVIKQGPNLGDALGKMSK